MDQFGGIGGRGVRSGDLLDVRVERARFGAFLDAESLVEGAPQLQRLRYIYDYYFCSLNDV